MSRRSRKREGAIIGVLIVVGVPIWLVSQIIDGVGWVIPLVVVAAIVGVVMWSNHDKKVKRHAYLLNKYGNESLVDRIMNGHFWEGQSAEQLQDSLGAPVAVDNKMLKTKTREVWKYSPRGANRYGLRITVENGFVVGWDQKSQ